MAADDYFDLPENIDDRIRDLVAGHRTLTEERVIRDIARIHCLIHMVEVGILGMKLSSPEGWRCAATGVGDSASTTATRRASP
jgi:hypothetical protein